MEREEQKLQSAVTAEFLFQTLEILNKKKKCLSTLLRKDMLYSEALNTESDSTRYSGAGNFSDRDTCAGHKDRHALCDLEVPELRGNNSGSQDLQHNFGQNDV